MLMQLSKRNIVTHVLFLILTSTIVCAPHPDSAPYSDSIPDPIPDPRMEEAGLLEKKNESFSEKMSAWRRRMRYALPSKSTWEKIGGGCCAVLTCSGIIAGCIIVPSAIISSITFPCEDSVNWNRLHSGLCPLPSPDREIIANMDWAVAECQNDILKSSNSCVPICFFEGDPFEVVPNGWSSTVNISAACKNFFGERSYAVFCDPSKKDWAIEQFNLRNVSYCEIAGEEATVFMVPLDKKGVVVDIDAYYEKVVKDDAMESKQCKKYANKVRSIAGCKGRFVYNDPQTRGQKNEMKRQRSKNRRRKRSS